MARPPTKTQSWREGQRGFTNKGRLMATYYIRRLLALFVSINPAFMAGDVGIAAQISFGRASPIFDGREPTEQLVAGA